MTTSNRGRFQVSQEFFRDMKEPSHVANLFHQMIVLRAENDFRSNSMVYVAIHPDFEAVSEGSMAPTYAATFAPDSIYPKWVRVDD